MVLLKLGTISLLLGRKAMESNFLSQISKRGYIHLSLIEPLKQFCLRWQTSPGKALLEMNIFGETELADVIAECLRIPRVSHILDGVSENGPTLSFVDAIKTQTYAFGRDTAGNFSVIMVDPTDFQQRSFVESVVGEQVSFSVSERSEVLRAVRSSYSLGEKLSFLKGLK